MGVMPMIDANRVWDVQEAIEYVHRWGGSNPGAHITYVYLSSSCDVKRHL